MSAHKKPSRREMLEAVHTQYDHSTYTVRQPDKQSTDTGRTQLKRYDVRMDPGLWDALGAMAQAEGTSRGALIRKAIILLLK